MTALFEERGTFELYEKNNDTARSDAVLRVIVHSSRDPHSRIDFTIMRNDGRCHAFSYGLGWWRDTAALASSLDATGYDLGRHPIVYLKAWLFDLLINGRR